MILFRALPVLVLGGLSISCGPTVYLKFEGRNITDTLGAFRIRGEKDRDRVIVESPRYGFDLSLPYAEDWEIYGIDSFKEVFLKSYDVGVMGFVKSHPTEGKVDTEAWLRDYLEKEYRSHANELTEFEDAAIERIGTHPVLHVTTRRYRKSGFWGQDRVLDSHHLSIISARQAIGGPLYTITFNAHANKESPNPGLQEILVEIAGKEFDIR